MIYNQKIAWPTRRKHLFHAAIEENLSICGLVEDLQCDQVRRVDFVKQSEAHAYNDLNYCQSCLRVALKEAGQKYKPLTEYYENLRKRWEDRLTYIGE